MEKIKIVYFIDDLHLGGAEKLLLQLIQNLDVNKFESVLITLSNKGVLFKNLPYNLKKVYTTKNPFRLWHILKNEKPDIFHSHLWRSDFIGIPIARLAGIKSCFSTRHNVKYFRGINKILIPIDAMIMRFLARAVITISDAVKKFYDRSSFYKGLPFTTIYNGIELEPFFEINKKRKLLKKKNDSSFKLLTIASLSEQKGHEQFLDVLKNLRNISFEWHIVGKGAKENRIKVKAESLGLSEKLVFHGEQTNVLQFYEESDLFVLPSLWEGFGLVLIEAMASGVPVFASDVDGIREIIKDGENGILFDIDNHGTAQAKLKEVMLDKSLREKFSEQSQKSALEYSICKMKTSYENLYLQNIRYPQS